jgi:hypothetical protein
VSSRLLPERAQVATHRISIHAELGSKMIHKGIRWVAGWVAGCEQGTTLTYGQNRLTGSKCSTFVNKLRVNSIEDPKRRIGVTMAISCYTCYPGVQVGWLEPPGRDPTVQRHGDKVGFFRGDWRKAWPRDFKVHRPDGAT